MSRFNDELCIRLARLIPRRVRYWVVINAFSDYTVKRSPRSVMGSVTMYEVMEEFE